MRTIRNSELFGEPALQVIETRDVNNIQARVFDLILPLKLDEEKAAAGGKT